MEQSKMNSLGIDIGSTTVKISILDPDQKILFSAYKRHYANIQETLSSLLSDAHAELGDLQVSPMITGSGGLTLAKHLGVPFVQEVIAVSTALTYYAPKTDVAIELGGVTGARLALPLSRLPYRAAGLLCGLGTLAGLLLPLSGSVLQMAAGGFLAVVCDDAFQTLTDARLNNRFPSDQRATLISVSSMCFSLVMIALSPLAGAAAGFVF